MAGPPRRNERLLAIFLPSALLAAQVLVGTLQCYSVATLSRLGEARAGELRREEMIRSLSETGSSILYRTQVLVNYLSFERRSRGSKAHIDLSRIDLSCTGNSGRDCFRCPRDLNLENVDFSEARFVGADFRDGELSGAILRGADFSFADLRGASLQGVNLESAKFVSADLRKANLKESFMESTRMSFAKLDGANISGAIFRHNVSTSISMPLGKMQDLIAARKMINAPGPVVDFKGSLEVAVELKSFWNDRLKLGSITAVSVLDSSRTTYLDIDAGLREGFDAITSAAIVDGVDWGSALNPGVGLEPTTLLPFSVQDSSYKGIQP